MNSTTAQPAVKAPSRLKRTSSVAFGGQKAVMAMQNAITKSIPNGQGLPLNTMGMKDIIDLMASKVKGDGLRIKAKPKIFSWGFLRTAAVKDAANKKVGKLEVFQCGDFVTNVNYHDKATGVSVKATEAGDMTIVKVGKNVDGPNEKLISESHFTNGEKTYHKQFDKDGKEMGWGTYDENGKPLIEVNKVGNEEIASIWSSDGERVYSSKRNISER